MLAMGFNIFCGRRGLPFYIYPFAFMLRRRKRRGGALLTRLDNSAGLKAIESERMQKGREQGGAFRKNCSFIGQ